MRFTWLAILVVASCQSGLDREKLDKEIVATLKDKGVDATVDCPEVKKLAQGTKFECTGVGFGKHFKIDVSVTDDKGTVRWDLVGKIVETKKLADFVSPQITTKLAVPVQITCADPKAILAPGDSITCDIAANGENSHVGITVANNGDDVTWEILK